MTDPGDIYAEVPEKKPMVAKPDNMENEEENDDEDFDMFADDADIGEKVGKLNLRLFSENEMHCLAGYRNKQHLVEACSRCNAWVGHPYCLIWLLLFQLKKSSAALVQGRGHVKDNPLLTDNWDDTEGYYR